MSDDDPYADYLDLNTEKGGVQLAVLLIFIVDIVLFVYHCCRFNDLEHPQWFNAFFCFGTILAIVGMTVTVVGASWSVVDLTIGSNDLYVIYYIGVFILALGSFMFGLAEYYLSDDEYTQSPIYLNDFSLQKIQLSSQALVDPKPLMIDSNNNNNDTESGNTESKDNKKYKKLITHGLIYKYIRHPMQTAVVLIVIGYFLAAGNWFECICWGILSIAEFILIPDIERSLIYQFGNEYIEYMNNTHAFFPTFLFGSIVDFNDKHYIFFWCIKIERNLFNAQD